jgi:hypothetical protein
LPVSRRSGSFPRIRFVSIPAIFSGYDRDDRSWHARFSFSGTVTPGGSAQA